MAGSQIWRVSRIGAADGRASTASGRGSRSHRPGLRLWTLLNAQAAQRHGRSPGRRRLYRGRPLAHGRAAGELTEGCTMVKPRGQVRNAA
jgi:hypothetical protein